jgi:hypothetical protein
MPLGAGGQLDAKTAQKTIIGFSFPAGARWTTRP